MRPHAHLLVVDDDEDLCEMLLEYFVAEGYGIDICRDGRVATDRVRAARYDLVILDVMLPGMGGMDVLREVRRHSNVPVVMLTARGERSDRIVGLELGADDYLPKPFDPRELLARIRAVLRRYAPPSDTEDVRFGALRLVPTRRAGYLGDSLLNLTTLEYDLLLALVRKGGQVVTREELAEAAGRRLLSFDRSIDMHLVNIRRKLSAVDGSGERIATVRGSGYMLMLAEEEA